MNHVGSEKAKELSVSARKLAATLWEIDGLPCPRVKREDDLEEDISELGVVVRKERISRLGSVAVVLSDLLLHSPVSEVGLL